MMNRLLIVKGLFLATALTACGTVTEREYTDNDVLERPPALARQRASDDKVEQVRSETPKKAEKGLAADVSINSESPLQIGMRRSFDIAWHDLELILKQKEIEIKDREHDKGQYYVTFDADDYQSEDSGFLDKSTSFFKNDYTPVVYILTVEADGSDARINAAIASDAEQTNHGMPINKDSNLTDGADKLLLYLYKGLRDDLVEE
jgi:NlpB/DapX lipoprotein